MPVALTCDCGARFEVEDLLAGQEVHCPECHARLRVPGATGAPGTVSLLALSGLVLAVVGAFTLVGSIPAVGLAVAALAQIHGRKSRLGGSRYAVAAIVIALLGAGVTLALLWLPAGAALAGWLRTRAVAGQFDAAVPAQVGSRDNVCVLTRPAGWGRLRGDRGFDSTIDTLQAKRDVLLCNPRGDAYLDVRRDASAHVQSLSDYRNNLLEEFGTPPTNVFNPADDPPATPQNIRLALVDSQALPEVDGYEAYEWTVDYRRGGQWWRWLVRGYRKPAPPGAGVVYVVRAYARRGRFAALEPTLRSALDGVRFPP